MPRPILYLLLVLVALTLVPMGLVYRTRATRARTGPRIQVVSDMDEQVKYKTQTENPFFADGRPCASSPRAPWPAASCRPTTPYFRGTADAGHGLRRRPSRSPVTAELVARGRERFDIFCAPCHGLAGDGDGLVHRAGRGPGRGHLDAADRPDQPRRSSSGRSGTSTTRSPTASGTCRPTGRRSRRRTAGPSWPTCGRCSCTRNATIDDVPAEVRATLQ